MRKLFRFKYEPCKGDCYAWCDSLPNELNKLTDEDRQLLVLGMVKAHDRLCDNLEYSFGVDFDKDTQVFVAHFRTPTSTDIRTSSTFQGCVQEICALVLSTDIPQVEGACSYGDNGAEDLGREILRACTDIAFREKHHEECPCHGKVA
jgi:hypothetical protein